MSSPALEIPTHEDLTRTLHQMERDMYVYNPAPEWVLIEHGGRPYWLPPDRGGVAVDHPTLRERDAQGRDLGPLKVAADGRLGLKSAWGWLEYQRGQGVKSGKLPGQDAWEIVKFMAEKHADRGIIYLRGDDSDVPRMTAAKKIYQANVRNWALEQQQARAEFVSHWRQQPGNKGSGKLPPPPTAIQLQAQELLDELGVERRDAAAFVCRVCFGYETADWEKFARHMAASHNRPNERREDYDAAAAGGAPDLDDDEEDDEEDDDIAPPAARSGKGKQGRRK
jgi:hypothetical protein